VDTTSKNPVRKVVTLLQNLQKKIEKEAEAEKELFDKFICYCKTAAADLEQSIADSTAKVPELQSTIESSESELGQLKPTLKQHHADQAAVKAAMAEATSLRERENADYEKEATEAKGYVKEIDLAVGSIEKGMSGGSLLQSASAAALQHAVESDRIDFTDDDRRLVMSFLTDSAEADAGYTPKGSEVTGILKSMRDDYAKVLGQLQSDESQAKETYDELMAAKGKEDKTLAKAIERKTARVSELSVSIASMKDDLTDTEAALIEDQKLSKTIASDCKAKQKEFAQRVASRGEELVAVADTIKILNDDDALELFKKTLPAAGGDFLQLHRSRQQTRQRVLELLHRADAAKTEEAPSLRFLEIALAGGKVDFSKVIKMIDDMVNILTQDQVDDDNKKEYCKKTLGNAEDKLKELSGTESDLETAIEDGKATMEQLKADIKSLNKGIEDLDKSVRDATEQRKEENEEFTDLMSSNTAAKELLEFAKNRLNKFYNPKQYNAPPKTEQAEFQQEGLSEVTGGLPSFLQELMDRKRYSAGRQEPPAEAPPTPTGPVKKKTEESGGIIKMIDLLIRDLDREMIEAEEQEKSAQREYEGVMLESSEKRAKDAKLIAVKEASRADTEEALVAQDGELTSTRKELMATDEYKSQIHSECDWLLKYFDLRKQARAEESDNLKKAKATLSGADFSLLQDTKSSPGAAFLAHDRPSNK